MRELPAEARSWVPEVASCSLQTGKHVFQFSEGTTRFSLSATPGCQKAGIWVSR